MNKAGQIIVLILVGIWGFVAFFLHGSIWGLSCGVGSIGMILSALGERIISRILMILCVIGMIYCGYHLIMFFVRAMA